MIINEIKSSDTFEADLESGLSHLAALWNVSGESDEGIEDVRKAAHFILGAKNLRVAQLTNKAKFKDVREFFDKLVAKNYVPQLYGATLLKGTTKHLDAINFLKAFASQVGSTMIREEQDKLRTVDEIKTAKKPMWANNKLIPTDHEAADIASSKVTETPFIQEDWENVVTMPAALELSPKDKFQEEQKIIASIIDGDSSPLEFQNYLYHKLLPRVVEINAEYEERHAKYTSESAFRLGESVLVDFKEALDTFIIAATNRLEKSASQAVETSPFPELPELTDKTKIPPSIESQLQTMAADIHDLVESLSGDELREVYQTELKPKLVELHQQIFNLRASGINPSLLAIKEKHFEVIKVGASNIFTKIADERNNKVALAATETAPVIATKRQPPTGFIPTLNDVIEPAGANIEVPTEALAAKATFLEDDQFAKGFNRFVPANTNTSLAFYNIKTGVPEKIVPPQPTSRDVGAAITIGYKDKGADAPADTPVAAKKSGSSILKRMAMVVGAAAVTVGVVVVGLVGGTAFKEFNRDQAAKVAISAKAEFNNKAQQTFVAPAETFSTAKPAPANDITAKNVTAAFDITIGPKTTKTVAPKGKETSHGVKVTSHTTAKASFAPAAENVVVQDNRPMEIKPFEISSFRMDISTLAKACAQVAPTDPNGVCANFAQQAPKVQ